MKFFCVWDSVVVESLCLMSESRLESPVNESESSPSHKKKIGVGSESSPLLIRVKSKSSPSIDPHRV